MMNKREVMEQIKTEEDYKKALKRAEELFDLEPGHPDYEEAQNLMTLVDLYEQEHYPT